MDHDDTQERSEAGRRLVALRRRIDTTCTVCGKPLHGVTTRKKYCGLACQSKAWRERQRAIHETQP